MERMPENKLERLLLDARETARLLSISPRSLWTLTQRGDIAHVRAGRRVLYSPADLAAWIDRQRTLGTSA